MKLNHIEEKHVLLQSYRDDKKLIYDASDAKNWYVYVTCREIDFVTIIILSLTISLQFFIKNILFVF